jgi:thermitase
MLKKLVPFVISLTLIICIFPFIPITRVFGSNGRRTDSKWDFAQIEELESIACVHGDRMELVVGVDSLLSGKHVDLMISTRRHGGKIAETISMGDRIGAVVIDIPTSQAASFVDNVQEAQLIAYAEPNLKFRADFSPNDPDLTLQWGLSKIGATYAWNKTVGTSSLLLSVVDTGIDYNHPDLAANYVPLGYDWVNDDTDPMDDNNHGTHCAGIIAAALNNSIGIAGLAQIRIMAEKGLDTLGDGYETDLANAIVHSVDHGAKIISMSWGDYEDSSLIHNAISYAYSHQVLLVAAAGNEATNSKLYPAAYDEVVAVTATDRYDNPASFTNYGNWVELAAPGVSVYSTFPAADYGYLSGTSMATPHVAGVAALVWSYFPEKTRDEVRMRLRETADDLGTPGFDVYYGYGRTSARKALEMIHNIAIKGVSLQKTVVGQGFNMNLNVKVANDGTSAEIFNVKIYANSTVIHSENITLDGETFTSITSTMNTSAFSKGAYIISAHASLVANESRTADNTASGGTITVTIVGDVNGDSEVDILDLVKVSYIYSSRSGDAQFNSNSDINGDDEITISDIVLCTSHYGQKMT